MRRGTHAALTAGLASAGSAVWVRDQLGPRFDYLEDHPEDVASYGGRLARRAHLPLAGAIVTGSAVITSAELDRVEQALFDSHRKEMHSLVNSSKLKLTSDAGRAAIREQVELACDTLGIENEALVIRTVEAVEQLLGFLTTGSLIGQLTHVLGDLPTKGDSGFAGLELLHPVSDRALNLGWIAHGHPLANELLTKLGLALTAASWAAVGVYVSAPRWPKSVLHDGVAALREESTDELARRTTARLVSFPKQVGIAVEEFGAALPDDGGPSLAPE